MSDAGNTKSEKRAYHHGDLRAALIETGMRLIEFSDADRLSLREVSREVGVSAAAVYRHFPDKDAFLAALAEEGLDRLGAAQRQAAAEAGYGAQGFNASGRTYVRFALKHPALFKMIMSHTPQIDHFAADATSVSSPMRWLRSSVAALAPEGTSPEQLRSAALRAWSKVHGLTMLILDGQIAADDGVIEAVIDGRDIWPETKAQSITQ
ncbi:MAG: TetR/AcrR family transcriptional regulator [Pseudomonadota bacterium]